MDLLNIVNETIEQERLFAKGEKIIVAVSGGPDSIALLHLLYRLIPTWRFTIVVAHVDHGFRGEQSAQEAGFVRQMAEQLGLIVETTHIDLPQYIEKTGENAQKAARDKRYAFLRDVAARYGTKKIALGHHANDQAETVLMRIMRGTSSAGLGGMSSLNEVDGYELVRPLLNVTKDMIIAYCHEYQLSFVTDPSNLKSVYFRNAVRLEVLPMLKRFNPQIEHSLIRLSDIVRSEHALLEQMTKKAFDEIVDHTEGSFSFARNSFLSLHLALQRRLITLILRYLSSKDGTHQYEQIEIIREAIQQKAPPSIQLDIGERIRFSREYERIQIGPEERGHQVEDETHRLYMDRFPCEALFPPNYVIQAEVRRSGERCDVIETGKWFTAAFDFDQIIFPLQVRTREAGDRMRVKGLNGRKKVKDIFIDEKIAPSVRNRLPLFVDGNGEVLWIPGIRQSDIAQLNASTTNVLHIRCRSNIT